MDDPYKDHRDLLMRYAGEVQEGIRGVAYPKIATAVQAGDVHEASEVARQAQEYLMAAMAPLVKAITNLPPPPVIIKAVHHEDGGISYETVDPRLVLRRGG